MISRWNQGQEEKNQVRVQNQSKPLNIIKNPRASAGNFQRILYEMIIIKGVERVDKNLTYQAGASWLPSIDDAVALGRDNLNQDVSIMIRILQRQDKQNNESMSDWRVNASFIPW